MKRLSNTRGETEVNMFERTRMPAEFQKRVQQQQQAKEMPQSLGKHAALVQEKMLVLYVKSNNKPSQLAYELASSLYDVVFVQNVENLEKSEIPPYLKGVPTLIDVKSREVFQGKHCMEKLDMLKKQYGLLENAPDAPEISGNCIEANPFRSGGVETIPLGIDSNVMSLYAPCEIATCDVSVYQTGRRKKEDVNSVIDKLLNERGNTTANNQFADLSVTEMNRIMETIKET